MVEIKKAKEEEGFLLYHWRNLTQPRVCYTVRTVLIIGVVIGIIFWGGFNTAMEVTNTEKFCISCHEMEANVYKEYRDTIHYNNRSGVRATCPDCHVPKQWVHKMIRKVQASNELYHKALVSFKGSFGCPFLLR